MGKTHNPLSEFQVNPLQFMQFPVAITADWGSKSPNKSRKWKGQQWRSCSSYLTALFFAHLLAFSLQPVTGQMWDGVAVTQGDFQALQAIKHELIDLKGALRSWNGSTGACSGQWAGIKCVKGQVIAIQLPWKALAGRISDRIGQLRELRKLSLHDNVISGTVPRSLGLLPNLRGIYLFNNRFSGSIPPTIGNLPLLQTLDLSNNLLTGEIPSGLANSTKLIRVNLSYNSLSGSIPSSFTQSFSLTILALQHNNISGTVPDSWGGRTCPLAVITLDHNVISGAIPASLSKLEWLQEISISENKISGAIPGGIGKLKRLRLLDLSNNAINGGFPSSFSNLSSLELLNVENNRLESQIPGDIDRLQNLSVVKLGKNRFSGEIPASLGNISAITQLDFSENNFTGQIPTSLTSLLNLTSFNVSYNNLSGPVPVLLSNKFNASSFVGNLQLCGFSASTPCQPASSPQNITTPSSEVRKPHRRRKLSVKDIILIAAGALLVLLLLLCSILLCCLLSKRAAARKNDKTAGKQATARSIEKEAPGSTEVGTGEAGGKLVHFDGPFVFTADDLLCATAEIMGKSTYGTAYKATLEDGNEVAVKRLREKTTKGQKEFETEVVALGKIRHPNLLALRAYYIGPKGEKLLVFDYMPRGSLSSFLHARGPETTVDWPMRMKIAIGITQGLNYLHTEENLIHGYLTSSNILLDDQTNARIADFGLPKLMTSAAATNVIATAGTQGYNAPELTKTKKTTTKTDVYSLGVIILELLTGKSPGEAMDGMDLPQWVASIVKEEWTNEVFDLELMKDAPNIGDELLNTLKLALHCVDPSPAARPDIQQILQQLEEIKTSTSGEDSAKTQPATE
ncbi:probably inactive leucine-rich repeat receptor-like protein kinase IMK2 [Cucurbita maxima]|uniref:Probably inactive leucine-rich repeat receptor-like protein kinase IMK2 n=1 Tax=Cucurbita maxima TaxID=3661 RepID=A0A6J1J5J9_CUCMA|nr:probably inactive leucine-rich repeat receptor-like protein kinase IMK2 [Cucurbita maxima]